MKFDIIKAAEQIYWLKFEDSYDLAMTFLRYQEFYESPNEQFRGKSFTILDFQEWYAKDRGGFFTYPNDWAGFNLPSSVIDQVLNAGISDLNKYDTAIENTHRQIKEEVWKDSYTDDYYLIGSASEELDPHEFGHARYYMDKAYRKEMSEHISALDGKSYQKLTDRLMDMGYTEKVLHDEIQAYLSTSNDRDLIQNCKKKDWERITEPFRTTYRLFNYEVPGLKGYFDDLPQTSDLPSHSSTPQNKTLLQRVRSLLD
jgi:hypothetical protein